MALYDAQQGQATENRNLHDKYVLYAKDWLTAQTQNARQGIPIVPASEPPLQNVYNDDYSVSHPPFPDLKKPVVDPKDVIPPQNPYGPGSGTGFGGINPGGQTNDTNAMMAALSQILKDMQAIKSALGIGAPPPPTQKARKK